MTKESIIACVAESTNQDISLIPDWSEFILGVVDINGNFRVAYDREGIILWEMRTNGLSRMEAVDLIDEWTDLSRGKNMPLFLDSLSNGLGR